MSKRKSKNKPKERAENPAGVKKKRSRRPRNRNRNRNKKKNAIKNLVLPPPAEVVVAQKNRPRSRKELPAWYRRVWRLSLNDNLNPEDFDLDLSELEEKPSTGELDERMEEDEEDYHSSYTGTEAEDYSWFKDMREDRKRQLLRQIQEHVPVVEDHIAHWDEVQAEYESLRGAFYRLKETAPLCFIPATRFLLYSPGMLETQAWFALVAPPCAEFYVRNEDQNSPEQLVSGHIYLGPEICHHLDRFDPPQRATPATTSVGIRYEPSGSKADIKFISQDHIKIKITRDLAFPGDPPASAPGHIELVGINAKIIEAREAARPRSPSPRESFFEMNHVGGWYREAETMEDLVALREYLDVVTDEITLLEGKLRVYFERVSRDQRRLPTGDTLEHNRVSCTNSKV